MPFFRKKPVIIEAHQWFKNGDHPEDGPSDLEGRVVRSYRYPDAFSTTTMCKHCDQPLHVHGWVGTLEGGHRVCPGDWIIKGVQGEFYPCKPGIFERTYEPADPDTGRAIENPS